MPNNVTTDLSNWKYQDNYVERIMDNAAYTAAHPDDTIVLVGPPRVRLLDQSDPAKGLKASHAHDCVNAFVNFLGF